MARTRRAAAPVPESNTLIASAIRQPPVVRNATGKSQAWQAQAWNYYDSIGELRFVANWVGNVMSRAKLVVAKDIKGVLVVQHKGPAVDALEAYFGGRQGQEQMLQQSGVHLTVAGECQHVAHKDTWATLSADRVTASGSKGPLSADFGDGKKVPLSGKDDMAIRVWTPHPRNPYYADAPTRANMSNLSEIYTISQHISAQLESRLAGAGILWVPQEITFPTPKEADPTASSADQFMQVLGEAMITRISGRSNASAVVPIVVQAPGDQLGGIRHMTFWTELDENVIPMRQAAVHRLALGLDTPPEVLLGVSDSNHWNAWLVDEAAIKSHLEPRLGVLAHAITTAFVRPAITGDVPDPENYYVLADTADIRLRPNRSREAIELYDRGELSGEAVLRETGFNPEDAPDDDESKVWLLRRIAGGSTSPEQTQAALRELGIDLGPLVEGTVDENGEIVPGLLPRRSLEGHPENKIPDRQRSEKDRESREGVIASCDVLVYRALERVGNRLLNGPKKAELTATPAQWRYMYVDAIPENAMEGAWGFAAEVLDDTGNMVQTARICAALDGYVRFILDEKRKHHRDLLEAALIGSRVIEP